MIGVDEVGRGCWAGPLLVVAARQIGKLPNGVTDSKLLSKKKREELFNLLGDCCDFGEGWVNPAEIDTYGMAGAMKLGVLRALNAIDAKASEEIIMDGSVNYCDNSFVNTKCIIGGDFKVAVVSAASIYAKVTRDRLMVQLSLKHPNYGFESHVGYGTLMHKAAISKFGVLNDVHRTSFKPVKAFL